MPLGEALTNLPLRCFINLHGCTGRSASNVNRSLIVPRHPQAVRGRDPACTLALVGFEPSCPNDDMDMMTSCKSQIKDS